MLTRKAHFMMLSPAYFTEEIELFCTTHITMILLYIQYIYIFFYYYYIYNLFIYFFCSHAPNHKNFSYIETGSLLKPVPKKYSDLLDQ